MAPSGSRRTKMKRKLREGIFPPPPPERRLGVLSLTEKQEALRMRKHSVDPKTRANGFAIMIDSDNIKSEFPADFDINTLKHRISAFLKSKNENHFVYRDVRAAGSMHGFFGEGVSRSTGWYLINVYDIYARNAVCYQCGAVTQYANPYYRPPVPYEKVTDVADDKLQNMIFSHVRHFGTDCNIMIYTGDSDFIRPLRLLRMRGVRVHLVHPRFWSKGLRNVVSKVYEFHEVLKT